MSVPRPFDDCVPWTGCFDEMGYGIVTSRPKRRAHAAVYEALHGPLPTGHIVHHRCENKGCVNPAHLEALSRAEHVRLHRPRTKLTDEDVAEIRRRYPGESQQELADAFGVGRSQVGRIVRGQVRVFDFERDAPQDVAPRRYPPIAGSGRGIELDDQAVREARRKLQGRRLTPRGRRT